jgi:hypothetical protein
LAQPLALDDADLWASIQCSRGQSTWPLAEAAAAGGAADPDAISLLRRQLPNGNYRALSAPKDLVTDAGVLRVGGEPPADAPIPLLEGGIGATGSPTAFSPNPDGVTLKLGADPAVTASTPGAFSGGALLLTFTSTSPGRIRVGPVTVAYETTGGTP